ncbi:hypothetical protein IGI67_000030 [Enterococcus sp. AZ196]
MTGSSIVKSEGIDGVIAKGLVGCTRHFSSRLIFTDFKDMSEVRSEILNVEKNITNMRKKFLNQSYLLES